jgi:hypothetical protein
MIPSHDREGVVTVWLRQLTSIRSNPPGPDRDENNQHPDPIELEILPLRLVVINQALNDLYGARETKDIECSGGLPGPILAQQQGNNGRGSKQHYMDEKVAGRSPIGCMQPYRLERQHHKEGNPGGARPT